MDFTVVDAYILKRQRQAAAIRQETEQCFNPVGMRDRLLARCDRALNLL